MIKRALLAFSFLGGLTFFACADTAQDNNATDGAAGTEMADAATEPAGPCDPSVLVTEALSDGTKILEGVTLDASTPIAEILGDTDAYAGKMVRIEGIVVEICSGQGCYVTLQDPAGNKLNLKVIDGELDFRELVETGQYAVGEGVFSTEGEHGAQLDIMEAGAMVGSTVCAL